MRKSILFISFLLAVCFLPIDTFGECIKGDCKNGQGTATFPDGSKYVGGFKDDMPNGQGTATLPYQLLLCSVPDQSFTFYL